MVGRPVAVLRVLHVQVCGSFSNTTTQDVSMLNSVPNRRISTFFSLTKHWQNYDIFSRQKMDTFRTSRNAVVELASRYKEFVTELRSNKDATHDEEAEKLLFTEMFEICLWGNATDLSLLTNLTYEDIQKLQGSQARKAAEKNILINHLPEAYAILKKARDEGKKERRVDFVLDNSGFELYVDLVLAGFLLTSGLATHIILRPKSIPWFVSDVLPGDYCLLLNAIADPKKFFETQSDDEKAQDKTPAPLADKEAEDLLFVSEEWTNLYAEGQIILRPNRYWTAGGSFWRLPAEAHELHEDMKGAELTIFKGDLNYRKLTGDVRPPPSSIDMLTCFFFLFWQKLTRTCRLTGIPLPRGPPPSAPWALDPGSTSFLCEPARLTLLSAFRLAKTKN